ncbi:hypothetical protein EPO34_04060 [Patescibacteria group bacterium]|nr:MAG: hypothetical protein EPO34_04060 [Patescibacteria group bacterium]
MNRLFPALVTASLLLPLAASAAQSDRYADAFSQVSRGVLSPGNALGGPDQAYADFLEKDATLTLDLGEGEEGIGALTVYDVLLEFGAQYRAEFLDAEGNEVKEVAGAVPLSQTSFVVPYDLATPYRFVRLTSTREERWKLDAVESAGTAGTPAQDLPAAEEPETAGTRGLLVKLPDDGDPTTDMDSAVYAIGGDGMRHAFPSLTVYRSWYADFSDVAFIDPEHLASYQLGKNVTVRAGTYLVKLMTDPKVYAVEPGSILRPIASEEVARELYGADWAKRVIDIPDTFFRNYVVGAELTDEAHPDGTLGSLPSGEVVYVDDAVTRAIPAFSEMRFRGEFVVTISTRLASTYAVGTALGIEPDIRFPY